MVLRNFMFLFCFCQAFAFSQRSIDGTTARADMGLKGKVKSIHATHTFYFYPDEKNSYPAGMTENNTVFYHDKALKKDRNKMNDQHFVFNNHGNKREEIKYHGNGQERMHAWYDAHGNKIQADEFYENGNLKNRTVSTYNNENQLVESKHYDDQQNLLYRHAFEYLQGKVKRHYKYKNLQDTIRQNIYTYDADMNLLSASMYDENRAVIWATTYTYDNQANLRTLTSYNAEGEQNYTSHYHYDQWNNRIAETRNNRNGDILYRYTYKYDEKNRKINENVFDSFNQLTRQKNFHFHKKGWLEKMTDITYLPNGNIDDVITTVYDAKGNILKKETVGSTGEILILEKSKYNAKGHLVMHAYANYENENYMLMQYRYNAQGNLLSSTEKKTRKNQVTIEKYHYSYTYDKKKNWVKQIGFKGDQKAIEVERKIDYY